MFNVVLREFTRCLWIPGNSSRGEATSGASLNTEAMEELAGENLGGARGSKERL